MDINMPSLRELTINAQVERSVEMIKMYMDTVVLSGLAIVVLSAGFFGAAYVMIRKDMEKHPPKD